MPELVMKYSMIRRKRSDGRYRQRAMFSIVVREARKRRAAWRAKIQARESAVPTPAPIPIVIARPVLCTLHGLPVPDHVVDSVMIGDNSPVVWTHDLWCALEVLRRGTTDIRDITR